MLSAKEREERVRSIRKHLLDSTRREGRLQRAQEVNAASNELKLLTALEEGGPPEGTIPVAWTVMIHQAREDLRVITEAALLGDFSPHPSGSVSEASDRLTGLLDMLTWMGVS
jgi:hypothetical protein